MTCLECGQSWDVPQGPAPVATPHSQPTRPTAKPGASGVDPRRRPQRSASGNVICPECGHRFLPTGPPRSAGSRPGRKNTRTILLVEDQNYFTELTKDALGDRYRTVVADSVSRARELIDSAGFDLVILDLSLEGQDGSVVLRSTSERGIPVLIFTARDESVLYEGEWENLRARGATDILIKGMNVGDELRSKVDKLLRSSS